MADYVELVKDLLHCATSSEACTSCNRKNERYCQDNLHTEAADAIEKLQGTLFLMKKTAEFVAEKVPKWTPVTERLPEPDLPCICWCKGGTYGQLRWYELHYLSSHRTWEPDDNDGIDNIEVTHWMPLPEPPKEETE